ncbi:unnamed protein product [Microthlaspi erraticum]|uniref:FBD domain-containing protein n=1 Tax=Microthlaspi erraticum TaxID=1685480 RepID=A0A6D2ICS2_9BRAS|nr:unnamed protein product [Microthlaspi erraticum]
MNGIQNVQKLDLNTDTLEVLALCCESMPVFNNVKFLGVSGKKVEGLIHDVTDKCGDACPCISREDRGLSLKSCPVNRLEIQGFRGTMKEMDIIKHFLDFLPSLKRFDVFVEDEPTQSEHSSETLYCLTVSRRCSHSTTSCFRVAMSSSC